MAVEDEQGAEQRAEAEVTGVEPEAASELAADDEDVEAHTWRAQS